MNQPALTSAQIKALQKYDTATVCNAIECFAVRPRNVGYMDQRIKCVYPKLPPMVGYAVTATFRSHAPARSGDVYSALEKQIDALLAGPQPPVIVFQDLDNPVASATFGEVMCTAFKTAGAAGLITSGAGRDIPQVEPLQFPVFMESAIASHGYCHVMELNVPVHVGGITIYPGDLLHGDINGVTTIPHEIAPQVAEASEALMQAEGVFLKHVRESKGSDPTALKAEFGKLREALQKLGKQYKC